MHNVCPSVRLSHADIVFTVETVNLLLPRLANAFFALDTVSCTFVLLANSSRRRMTRRPLGHAVLSDN